MGLQKEIHVSPKNKTGENYAKFLELDILIVGGGFSGVYLLYELRKKGYKVKIFEAADGLGGVWKWNQYPGARVDSDIPIYELSIPEVYNTWNWKEKFPGWQELQDYFEHVDKVCDISKDVAYDTRVIDGIFDEKEGKWTIKTEDGRICKCKYFLPCVGFAAKRYFPDWKGLNIFKGTICHSSFWPKEDFDVTNKNCAVIGTGSTGVQIIQEWAKK
uniref:Cyclopentanone 1,2-monooxygenase n=1 Tax=Panagrolaimus sp. JU765 TaxID=591449 RepID=A0AC34R7S8_9BILA